MNIHLSDNETCFLFKSKNGQFDASPSQLANRAYLYGDGIFETMIFTGAEIRFGKQHISRAFKGCTTLNIELKVEQAFQDVEQYLKEKFPGKILRVRWNIYRDSVGKYTPVSHHASESLILEAFTYTPPQQKSAFINKQFVVPNLPWSNCKTLNALVYVQAGISRKKAGMDEVILLEAKGNVCEAGASNLFWKKDGVFYSPCLTSSCIEGVGRAVVMEKLQKKGYSVVEGEFKPSEIMKADLVFTTNVTGIHYIEKINSTEFNIEPIEFIENLFVI
ncbi:aminotransferase class IV [Litoribacter alkaliphilus]|uniref:branched-chain-amino-acid transaminase n=1 Tax=Litoribacter ruber TaxID=702568 RepID=A0AAP2CJE6_9BACT|nr:aminotransferase class IV [Litoribacter alkaliphilus]MBS9524829.1 aminotransferase class IV [Litoribacter alkaliphilus]